MATRRARICLTCRTLFDEDESCSGNKHQTVSIRDAKGRQRLDDEVWGPDSRARRLRQTAKAGAGGAGVGSVFKGCNGLEGCNALDAGDGLLEGLAILAAIIVFAVVAMLLFWLVRRIVRAVREAMHKPQPHGALLAPPKLRRAVAARGVVRSGTPLATPWKPGSVFAYAMELYEKRVLGGGAMLRDAATAGFEVALDDGRTLRVPAGRVRILGKLDVVEIEKPRVETFVRGLDEAASAPERPLFPFDHARAQTIGPGDRVELLGDVEVTANGRAAGYRDNASVVMPIGVPVLRVHKGAATSERVRIADDATAEAEPDELDEPSSEASVDAKKQRRAEP